MRHCRQWFRNSAQKALFSVLRLTALLLAVSQSGNAAVIELWVQRYDGPSSSDDVADAVVIDASGNVIITGRSYDYTNNGDYYTAKYSAGDGKLIWQKRYNGPANGLD